MSMSMNIDINMGMGMGMSMGARKRIKNLRGKLRNAKNPTRKRKIKARIMKIRSMRKARPMNMASSGIDRAKVRAVQKQRNRRVNNRRRRA